MLGTKKLKAKKGTIQDQTGDLRIQYSVRIAVLYSTTKLLFL